MVSNFTIVDAIRIAEILPLVTGNERITWTPDCGDTLKRGTARRFCTEDYLSIGDSDIRDAFLHVTLDTGMETLIPVREAMEWIRTGALAKGWR